MNKLVKRIMAIVLVFTIVGSSLYVGTAEAASDQTKAKKYLNSAVKDCIKVMDTIDSPWYFQVFKADEYTGEAIIYNYASNVVISESKVKEIIEEEYGYGKTDWAGQAACIQVLSYNLGRDSLESGVDNAKDALSW